MSVPPGLGFELLSSRDPDAIIDTVDPLRHDSELSALVMRVIAEWAVIDPEVIRMATSFAGEKADFRIVAAMLRAIHSSRLKQLALGAAASEALEAGSRASRLFKEAIAHTDRVTTIRNAYAHNLWGWSEHGLVFFKPSEIVVQRGDDPESIMESDLSLVTLDHVLTSTTGGGPSSTVRLGDVFRIVGSDPDEDGLLMEDTTAPESVDPSKAWIVDGERVLLHIKAVQTTARLLDRMRAVYRVRSPNLQALRSLETTLDDATEALALSLQ